MDRHLACLGFIYRSQLCGSSAANVQCHCVSYSICCIQFLVLWLVSQRKSFLGDTVEYSIFNCFYTFRILYAVTRTGTSSRSSHQQLRLHRHTSGFNAREEEVHQILTWRLHWLSVNCYLHREADLVCIRTSRPVLLLFVFTNADLKKCFQTSFCTFSWRLRLHIVWGFQS